MGTIYDRIEELCNKRGITGGKMCNDLWFSGFPFSFQWFQPFENIKIFMWCISE